MARITSTVLTDTLKSFAWKITKEKCVFCSKNRSPTRLLSLNMQNSESVLREMKSCAFFVFVMLGEWGCGCNSQDLCSCIALCFVIFFSPSSLSSLSILLKHNGRGVVKLLQNRTKLRYSSVNLVSGLMNKCTNYYF